MLKLRTLLFMFFFLLYVFVGPFFFGCSVLFWFHNSPLGLPVNLLIMRYSFFYCQLLEIKLSPHILKWRQQDVFVWWRSCNSSPLQFRLRTLTTQSRVLMYWNIVKAKVSPSEGLYQFFKKSYYWSSGQDEIPLFGLFSLMTTYKTR